MRNLIAVISALWLMPVWAQAPVKIGSQAAEPVSTTSVIQLLVALIVVLFLIFSVAWVVKRYGTFKLLGGQGLRILGVVSVGTRERIVLMQVGEEQILVGVAPGSVRRLHVLQKNIEVEEGGATKAASGFAKRLAEMMKEQQK